MKKRNRKFIALFSNLSDSADDDWLTFFARDQADAEQIANEQMDKSKFTLDKVCAMQEFRKEFGRSFPI